MTQDLDKLLKKLEDDLEPVKKLQRPLTRAVIYFFAGLFSVVIIGAFVGFRMDLETKILEHKFLSEIIFIFILAGSAAYASAWLSVPDGSQKSKTIVFPYLVVAVAAIVIFREFTRHGARLEDFEFHHCIMDAMIMGIVPIFLMILMMKQGTPTRPVLSAVTNMIAAGSIGYLGIRLSCASDIIGHVCMYHIFPFVFVGLILGLIARRIYRW